MALILSGCIVRKLPLQRRDQLRQVFVPDDPVEALRSQDKPAGHPAVRLIGALPPTAHFADVLPQILEDILDAVRREQRPVKLVGDIKPWQGQ